jgi:hypothetical protein
MAVRDIGIIVNRAGQPAKACYRSAAEQKWIMLDDIAG